ncbi:unnamed protein product [Calypogeia fissa]
MPVSARISTTVVHYTSPVLGVRRGRARLLRAHDDEEGEEKEEKLVVKYTGPDDCSSERSGRGGAGTRTGRELGKAGWRCVRWCGS